MKKHQKSSQANLAHKTPNINPINNTNWHGTIERLAWGGIGISHTDDGKIILLSAPFAMFPGEIVKANIQNKNQYYAGQVTDWIQKDPRRCKTTCSVANVCGGCSLWEAGAYVSDLKRDMVQDLLSRQLPHITSWHWLKAPEDAKRHRIQLHWNGKQLGFYRRNSHSVVPIQTCPIATEPIAQAITRLQEAIENRILSPKIQRWELTTGTPVNTVYASIDDGRAWRLEPDGWHACTSPVEHNFDHISLQHKIGDFFQACPNWAWSAFKNVLTNWHFPNGTLYDLYGGVGLFSALLRDKFQKYVLVENSVTAIQHAERNLALLNLDFTCITADVSEWVSPNMGSDTDVLLLDPPRTGLTKELCAKLQTANVNTIILIGCDGAVFCRDLKRLAPTWQINHLTVIDLFPMTHHVECIAILQKTAMS